MARKKSAEKIIPELRKFAIDIKKLNPDKNNVRRHSKKNMEAIKQSLTEFGQRKPIIVQKKGMVIRAGNATFESAKELGWGKIAAVVIDEKDQQATAFAIADNRTGELAEWDEPQLYKQLDTLLKQHKISVPGFTDREINQLFATVEKKNRNADKPEVAFSTELLEENQYIVFTFSNTMDWNVIKSFFNLKTVHDKDVEKYGIGNRAGIGRVLSGELLLDALELDR